MIRNKEEDEVRVYAHVQLVGVETGHSFNPGTYREPTIMQLLISYYGKED